MTDKRTDLLVDIVSQKSSEPELLLLRALEKTTALLGLDFGYISRSENNSYIVEFSYHTPSLLHHQAPGKLPDTFCSLTLKNEDVVQIHDVDESEFKTHPSREIFGIQCYTGIPLYVNDDLFGTISFSGLKKREPFTKDDANLLVILSNWMGNVLHKNFADEIKRQEQKEYTLQIEKQLNQLKKMKSTREKLYSIIAHDIRNSIFGIGGLLDFITSDLKEGNYDMETVIYKMDMLQHSTKQVYKLLENLLTWVKVQSEEFDIQPKPFDITIQIDATIELLNPALNTKNISIERNYDHGTRVTNEPKAVNTIIRNLLNNAVKFSEPNSKINIIVSQSEPEGITEVSIQDFGTGMNRETLKNLFNPQKRPGHTGTFKESGSGLGLILSKELAELCKGDIYVSSKYGEGSIFTLIIPTNYHQK